MSVAATRSSRSNTSCIAGERATAFPKCRTAAERLNGGAGSEDRRRPRVDQSPDVVGLFGAGGMLVATSAREGASALGGRELMAFSPVMTRGPPLALRSIQTAQLAGP